MSVEDKDWGGRGGVVMAPENTAFEWSQEAKTPDLRFVRRDGKLILQQRILTTTPSSQSSKWVDIPVAENVE